MFTLCWFCSSGPGSTHRLTSTGSYWGPQSFMVGFPLLHCDSANVHTLCLVALILTDHLNLHWAFIVFPLLRSLFLSSHLCSPFLELIYATGRFVLAAEWRLFNDPPHSVSLSILFAPPPTASLTPTAWWLDLKMVCSVITQARPSAVKYSLDVRPGQDHCIASIKNRMRGVKAGKTIN